MDVGNPSNWERIRDLYANDYQAICNRMWSTSVSDEVTLRTMQRVYTDSTYIADPHTAVGLQAIRRYRNKYQKDKDTPGLVLSTAHPAKFQETVNDALGFYIDLPDALKAGLAKDKQAAWMPNNYDEFKEFLWEL